jgi:hypothetical protein
MTIDGMAASGNRGGGSHCKDACHDHPTSHHRQGRGVSFKISGEEK